jgi:SPOR domain
MSRVDAAAPMDRLPWLPDEPAAKRSSRHRGGVVLWAGAAILAVAAAGFWIGQLSIEQETPGAPQHGQTTTVQLPAPRPAVPEISVAPQPQVRLAPVPEVRPEAPRQVHFAPPRAQKSSGKDLTAPAAHDEQTATTASKEAQVVAPAPATAPPAPAPFVMPKPWPPRVVQGAAGRLVQVGAFGSIAQAKRGWRYMVRAYPAMAHLPAVVRPDRNSKGRIFYRFRVGTTSQAHSEVLCQRMLHIGLSCAVVGLPWKAKVER